MSLPCIREALKNWYFWDFFSASKRNISSCSYPVKYESHFQRCKFHFFFGTMHWYGHHQDRLYITACHRPPQQTIWCRWPRIMSFLETGKLDWFLTITCCKFFIGHLLHCRCCIMDDQTAVPKRENDNYGSGRKWLKVEVVKYFFYFQEEESKWISLQHSSAETNGVWRSR